MNKDKRFKIAQETISIIENGYYKQVDGTSVSISEELSKNVAQTVTYSPVQIEQLTMKTLSNLKNAVTTEIKVLNCSTIEALLNGNPEQKTAILNFASAKNPGGGFLGGASAQEESLARSSSLYASLTKDDTMYRFNKTQRSFLYSDYLIYSPETLFWFDDKGNVLNPLVKADVITSPAPNKGAMLQHNRKDEVTQITETFKRRMNHVLALAADHNIETLILGAWGCGVFRNETSEVAACFKEVIEQSFKGVFEEIVFAIYDTSEKKENFKVFAEVFNQ